MKTTKALFLTSILILATSCELQLSEDSASKKTNNSENFKAKVENMNHNSGECPIMKGSYKQVNNNDQVDFEPSYRELFMSDGEVKLLIDNMEIFVNGVPQTIVNDDGEELTIAASCEANILHLTTYSTDGEFFATGTIESSDNGHKLIQSINSKYQGKSSNEIVTLYRQ